MTPELKKRLARAEHASRGWHGRFEDSKFARQEAFKSVNAILSELTAAGYTVVRREPTDAMVKAVSGATWTMWQAMLAAAEEETWSGELVKRLREYRTAGFGARVKLLEEAADEIERLERIIQVEQGDWDTAAALVRANDECEQLQQLAEAAKAEVARLREVLEWLDRLGGLGLDKHERIRQALSSQPTGTEKDDG